MYAPMGAHRVLVTLLAATLAACAYDESGIGTGEEDEDTVGGPTAPPDAAPEQVPPDLPPDATPPPPTPPANVEFGADVLPMFERRGCVPCHTGNEDGKDLGGLQLDGSERKIHDELTKELSPNFAIIRVNPAQPESSVLLRLPSAEDPPDAHPVSLFASPADPDYLLLLGWVSQGAPRN